MVHNTMAETVLITFPFLQTIEILIKFLEAMPQISSIATNVIKLPSQKMADTSKDELLFIMISGFGIYGAAVVPYSGACNTWQRLTLVLHEFLSIGQRNTPHHSTSLYNAHSK